VRIRITKPMSGVLDGFSLTRFTPGLTYDVADAFGHQLIALHDAKEDTSNSPAIVIRYFDEPGTR